MRRTEFAAIKAHINQYMTDEEVRDMLESTTAHDAVRGGAFLAYYSQVWDVLREWYGEAWGAGRYVSPRAFGPYWETVDGVGYYLRMRGGEPVLWVVYVNKVASVLRRIAEV